MTTGGLKYDFVGAGSNSASAATAHSFFGGFGGLSDLHEEDVIHIQVAAEAAEMMLGVPAASITNDRGMKIYNGASAMYDLPPMRVGHASQLHVVRHTATNPTWRFSIWRGRPY